MSQHSGFELLYSVTGVFWKSENVTVTSEIVAASTFKQITYITTNGDADVDICSLADAAAANVMKTFVLKTKGNAGDSVEITPASFANGAKVTLGTVGECATFVFDGTNWHLVSTYGGVLA